MTPPKLDRAARTRLLRTALEERIVVRMNHKDLSVVVRRPIDIAIMGQYRHHVLQYGSIGVTCKSAHVIIGCVHNDDVSSRKWRRIDLSVRRECR